MKLEHMIFDGPMELGHNNNILIPYSPYQVTKGSNEDEKILIAGQIDPNNNNQI